MGEVLIGTDHAVKTEVRDYKRRAHCVISFTANALPMTASETRALAALLARAADELEQAQ